MLRNVVTESTLQDEERSSLRLNQEFFAHYDQHRKLHPLPEGWSEERGHYLSDYWRNCPTEGPLLERATLANKDYRVELFGGDGFEFPSALVVRNDGGGVWDKQAKEMCVELFGHELCEEWIDITNL